MGIVAVLMQMGLKFGGMMLLILIVAAASGYFQSQTQQLEGGAWHPLYNRNNAAVALVAFLMLLLAVLLPPQPPPGAGLLRLCVVALFPLVVIEGFRGSLDCLSAERRNGTMGLLLLTRLRGYDIVLGKLAGSSLAGLLQLLAILPIIFLSMFLGGVRGDEFARVSLSLLATYALACCFGVWISARASTAHIAFIQAFICVVIVFLMPAALWLSPGLLKSAWLAIPMSVSPGLMLATSFDTAYRIDPGVWQRAAYSIPLLCVGLLVAAGAHTRPWRPGAEEGSDRGASNRSRSRRWHRDDLDRDPLAWLTRTQGGGLLAGIKLTVVALSICVGIQWLQTRLGPWQDSTLLPLPQDEWTRRLLEPGALAAALFVQFSYSARLCKTASSLFQDGSFELLTATGIRLADIRRAIRRSLLREFLPPILVVGLLLVEVIFFNQHMVPEIRENLTELLVLQNVAITPLLIGLYCVSFMPIYLVGLWFSLKRGEPFSATINTWLTINILMVSVFVASVFAGVKIVSIFFFAFYVPYHAGAWAENSINKHIAKLTGR